MIHATSSGGFPVVSSFYRFLLESMSDEEDEILLTLAQELGKFVDYVGGPSHAYTILPPLQVLCAFDEPLVRQQVKNLYTYCCLFVSTLLSYRQLNLWKVSQKFYLKII